MEYLYLQFIMRNIVACTDAQSDINMPEMRKANGTGIR